MSLLHQGPSSEVIPAESVDELLRTVRVGLEQLDVELKQANLEIVQLERELGNHVNDLRPGDERIETARTAIEGVAVGAQEHLDKVVAAARAHAAARIAVAEADAGWIVQTAREEVARGLVAPLGVGDPVPPAQGSPPAMPARPTVTELAGWATDTRPPPAPPAPPQEVPRPAAEAPIEAPAPAPPARGPVTPAVAPAPATEREPAPETAAERTFWGDAEDSDAGKARFISPDLLLTVASGVLVILILGVVLAWIG